MSVDLGMLTLDKTAPNIDNTRPIKINRTNEFLSGMYTCMI